MVFTVVDNKLKITASTFKGGGGTHSNNQLPKSSKTEPMLHNNKNMKKKKTPKKLLTYSSKGSNSFPNILGEHRNDGL